MNKAFTRRATRAPPSLSELRLLGVWSVGLGRTACEAPVSGIILATPRSLRIKQPPYAIRTIPYAAIHKNRLAYKAPFLQLHPSHGCVFMCT